MINTDKYTVKFYINYEWIDVEVEPEIIINERLHQKLEPVDSSCNITLIPNQNLYNLLKVLDKKEIKAKIQKNTTDIFNGYVRKEFNLAKTNRLQPLNIELVSPSFILKRKIGYDLYYSNKTVSYILDDLLDKAGLTLATTPVINNIIPGLSIAKGEATYHELMTQLLFEYGYIFYFNLASGNIQFYCFSIDNFETTKIFDNTNTYNLVEQIKNEEEYEEIQVEWTNAKTITNAIVFSENENGTNNLKCNIAIPANSYLGDGSDENNIEWYPEFKCEKGELLSVGTLRLDIICDPDIEVLKFEQTNDKVLLSIKNINTVYPKNIYKLDIISDTATVKIEGTNLSRVVNTAESEKIKTYESKYIYNSTDGNNLASNLAKYYKYCDYNYKLQSRVNHNLGDLVIINDSNLGSNKAIIVSKSTNHLDDLIKYELESVDEYTPAPATNIISRPANNNINERLDAISDAIEEAGSYYRLLASTNTLKIYPDGSIKPELMFFRGVEVNPGTGGQGQYQGIFKMYIDETLVYESSNSEYEYYWIGNSILPQDNLYPSNSLLPVLDFYSNENEDVKEVYVQLWDATNSVKLDELYLYVIKDVSFSQTKIEQTIKTELPKYIGKFNQEMPTGYNRGDWFLIYGNTDSPFVRGLYKVGNDLTITIIEDDIAMNGVYFLSAMSDILSIVNDGYGEISTYGNITYIENLATNTIMTNYLLGENAQFTGTVRGGTRFNSDGSIADDSVEGYILLPNGNLIASNVELSGAISVDNEYVKRGVFRKDRFYPRSF